MPRTSVSQSKQWKSVRHVKNVQIDTSGHSIQYMQPVECQTLSMARRLVHPLYPTGGRNKTLHSICRHLTSVGRDLLPSSHTHIHSHTRQKNTSSYGYEPVITPSKTLRSFLGGDSTLPNRRRTTHQARWHDGKHQARCKTPSTTALVIRT